MKRLLIAAALFSAFILPAKAEVFLDTKLSGTGDNVVFNSITPNLVIGEFNGQNQGFVFFRDLSLNPNFIGAQNGNDIKIANTSNLSYSLFSDLAGTQQLYTATDVFSLKGTGSVTAFVTAVDANGNIEPIKTFDLGTIDPNAQSGFTFTTGSGELIQTIRLFDTGGSIADFEHYRVDVGTLTPAVPELSTWAMMILGFCTVGLLGMRQRRNGHPFRFA